MRWISVLLCIVCFAQVKEDLGEPLQVITNSGRVVFSAKGQTHIISCYDTANNTGHAQIFHINVTTGQTYTIDTTLHDRMGSCAVVVASLTTGNVWIVAYNNCHLFEYDLAGTLTDRNDPSWPAGACSTIGGDGPREIREGPDGKLWFTMATEGRTMLTQVDPVTKAIVEYGVPNPPPGNPTCTGCYRILDSMWVDDNYVYIGVRDMNANTWTPVWVKISDKSQVVCDAVAGVGGGGVLKQIADGALVWDKYISPTHTYYTVPTDGTCPTSTTTPSTTYYTYEWNGQIYYHKNGPGKEDTYFNIDIDYTSVDADSSNGGTTTLGYRTPAGSGAYTYKSATLLLATTTIKRVVAKSSTADYIVAVGGSYLSNSLFVPSTATTTNLGKDPSQSTYTAIWDGTYWYFAGYDGTANRFNPAAAWTVTAGNTIATCTAGTTNPCRAALLGATRHYWSALGNDGRVYFAGDWERDRTGGSIIWYNPADNTTGEYRLPELECFTSNEFISVDGGATMLYSGVPRSGSYGCAETTSKIFVFDVATQSITSSYTVSGITSSHGQLIALDNGKVMGLIYGDTSNYTLYSFNPSTGALDWTSAKTGDLFHAAAKYDRKAALGADGAVYYYASHNLTRASPTDGTTETVYTDSTGYGGMALAAAPSGQAFYLWGSTHLYRINLWRPAALRVKNSQSTATQIRLLYGRTTTLDATSQTVACAYEADCYVPIPGHIIGDMYYRWEFLTAGGMVSGASDITKVTL